MAYERATLFVVPAHAGTHNHSSPLVQKPLATVPKREAAAYGSPRPVRNCAPGGDDVERLHPHGDGSSMPCRLVNATVTSLVYTLPTISLAS